MKTTECAMSYEPRIIRSEYDHQRALSDLETLFELKPESGTEAFDRLRLLVLLVEDYTCRICPIDPPTAHSAIRFHMEQNGLDASSLGAIIDNQARATAILDDDAPLTLPELRALHTQWGISAEILIAE